MFARRSVYPKGKRKLAYADLTNSGKGILQQSVFNGIVNNGKLYSVPHFRPFEETFPFVEAVAYYPDADEFLLIKDDGLYRWHPYLYDEKVVDDYFPCPSFVYMLSAKTMLIASQHSPVYAYKDNVATNVLDKHLADITVFRDRCFGTDRKTLYYTKQGSATEWTGRIELPSTVYALVPSDDGLYLIGDDVYLLAFDDNEKNSKLLLVYRNFGVTFYNSVVGVGKGFMFADKDGIYFFNGSSVKKVASFEIAQNSSMYVYGAVCCGKYYLAYHPSGEQYNNRVAVVDVATQKLETVYDFSSQCLWVWGYNIFSAFCSQVFVMDNDKSSVIWQSRPYDFGSDRCKKSFHTLLIDTARDVTVTLKTESETRIIRVKGKRKLQKLPLHGSFRSFTLTLETDGRADIDLLGISATVYDEEVK